MSCIPVSVTKYIYIFRQRGHRDRDTSYKKYKITGAKINQIWFKRTRDTDNTTWKLFQKF